MCDTEAAAAAAAAAGSNKRSRLNVAECGGDEADKKKSDQRKKEAKIYIICSQLSTLACAASFIFCSFFDSFSVRPGRGVRR